MRVHDSQSYRKMDVTREHISRILELREILLSFQTGFNLVRLLSIYFNLSVDATGVDCHQLGLLSTDLHAIGCGGFVKMLS